MDYQALLFDPIYTLQGVAAELSLDDVTEPVPLTVLDKTAGVDVGESVNAQVIKPAAVARMVELVSAGVTVAQLADSSITFNGHEWDVSSYRMRPSPKGENDGEVLLILSNKRASA